MLKKPIALLLLLLVLFCWNSVSLAYSVNSEDLDFNNKLTSGANIAYWISPSCEYTVTIPNAANKLIYPSGLWNPLVLSRTTTQSQSKMDFEQYSFNGDRTDAETWVYRKNSSGVYYDSRSQMDQYDWVWGKIKINDYYMSKRTSSAIKEGIVLHEMLHVYGLKDLYNPANYDSIMYGYTDQCTALDLAEDANHDANNVLNEKY